MNNNLMATHFLQTENQTPINTNYLEMLNAAMNGNSNGVSPQNMQAAIMQMQMQMQMNGLSSGQMDNKLEVSWRNLVYQYEIGFLARMMSKEKKRVKVILKGLSGRFRGGELTAIMGPSGAGKSTLLECIAGKRKKGLSGDVKITGSDDIKIGIIAQSDYLIDHLTVRESLMFASKLKNYKQNVDIEEGLRRPSIVQTSNYHERLTDKVMNQLGLQICADNKCGNCSGGQKKRISMALEIISQPDILILDEPTSGLDSSACYQVVSVMQKMTQNSPKHLIAVVATIHQPSARVFNLFDRIYMISYDGQCIYQGSPNHLIEKLAKVGLNCPNFYNPADYISEVAAGEYGHEGIVRLADKMKEEQASIPLSSGPKTLTMSELSEQQSFPVILHTWLLFKRSMITIVRDPMLTSLRLFVHLIFGLFAGNLFGETIGKAAGCPPQVSPMNDLDHFPQFRKELEIESSKLFQNLAFLFFTMAFIMLTSVMPTIMTFPIDMQVLKKEKVNGWYSSGTYYMARTFADLPFQLLFPMLYSSIVYFMTGQPNEPIWRFIGFTGICIAVSLIAQSQGLLIGALFMSNANAAVMMGPVTIIPLLLFMGFFVRATTMPSPLRPIKHFNYFAYCFKSMVILLYGYDRCEFDASLAAQANVQPEWVEYLDQLFANRSHDPFVDGLMNRLGQQVTGGVIQGRYRSFMLDQLEISDDDDKNIILYSICNGLTFVILRVLTYLVLISKVNKQE